MENNTACDQDLTVLVRTAAKADATLAEGFLRGADLAVEICESDSQLLKRVEQGCGALLLAREVLRPEFILELKQVLEAQPSWSQVSVIVMTRPHRFPFAPSDTLEGLRNVTLLERPAPVTTLVSVAKSAIADRRRQYATRHLLEELEESNQALSDFAYTTSHDLQEPLRMITLYVKLLRKKFPEHCDREVQDYMHFIEDGAIRMRRFIENLLQYGRITKYEPVFESVDLNEIWAQVEGVLRGQIEENGAEILKHKLPCVRGDRLQLIQLFQNLLANAIKFRPVNQTPKIEVGAESEGDDLVCYVADNGIGISPDYFQTVFEPFRRLHTQQEYPGSGLGLSICKKIVERHNGRIWIDAQPTGSGSRFRFTLPIAASPSL